MHAEPAPVGGPALHGVASPTPEESPNFYRDWDAKDEEDRRLIAHAAMRTLVEVYGFRPEEDLGIELYLGEPTAQGRPSGDDTASSSEEYNGREWGAHSEGCECPRHFHAGVRQTFGYGRNV